MEIIDEDKGLAEISKQEPKWVSELQESLEEQTVILTGINNKITFFLVLSIIQLGFFVFIIIFFMKNMVQTLQLFHQP